MAKVFSNDPTAFLSEKDPVSAWNEMLCLEERAVFREIMGILEIPMDETRHDQVSDHVVLSLQYDQWKVVQKLHALPDTEQLTHINRRLEEYELFLSDCVYKMHSQLNEFSPRATSNKTPTRSLEAEDSYQLHRTLTGFEEKLMDRIGNLSLQIVRLGDALKSLAAKSEEHQPIWRRWILRLFRPITESPSTLNRTLTDRLGRMNHSLVQDFARLGTLWRFYNQHQVLRKLEEPARRIILDFCKKAYWWEFKGGWTREKVFRFVRELGPAIQIYEAGLARRWEVIKKNIDSALEVGVERQVENFQAELHDVMVTLGKFRFHFDQLVRTVESNGSRPSEAIEEETEKLQEEVARLTTVEKRLNVMSKEMDRFKQKVHPVLTELDTDTKRHVFTFVDLGEDLTGKVEDQHAFQQELATLLEGVDLYIDAIKEEVTKYQNRLAQGNGEEMYKSRLEALQLEIGDLMSVLQHFQRAYGKILAGDQKLSEFFGSQYQDLNTARMQEMCRQLEHTNKLLTEGLPPSAAEQA